MYHSPTCGSGLARWHLQTMTTSWGPLISYTTFVEEVKGENILTVTIQADALR